jgi:hypothetical protein
MSYDPSEVALLRQMIVKEQQSMKKRRGKGKVQHEMEGGSLASLASTFVRGFVPAVTKAASSASRAVRSAFVPRTSTALVKYNPAQAQANLARASAPSFASRASALATRAKSYTPSLSTLGNVASIGLPVGFTAYQAIDGEKQKKIAEGQAQEMERQNALAVADNKRQVDKEIEFLTQQQKLVEAQDAELQKENKRRQDEYDATMKIIEEERLKQAELDKKYQEEMDKQYQEMLVYNQQIIEAQIREAMNAYRPSYQTQSKQPPIVVPPSTSTQPYAPSTPSQGTTNPVVDPTADPTAGMNAKQRAAYYASLKKQGRGRHVDFQEGGNAWIDALKDWNNAETHRGEMWCLPKKGSKQINQVKKVMEKIKKGQKTPILAPQTKKTRSKKVKAVERGQTLLSFG